jgi:hypothetical protein
MLRRVALVRTDARYEEIPFLRNVRRLLVTANVVPSSPSLVTLMKEALPSSETSVLNRATQRNILEDTMLHSHHRENLKSYISITKLMTNLFLARWFFSPDDGGDTYLRNVGSCKSHTASHPRRRRSFYCYVYS